MYVLLSWIFFIKKQEISNIAHVLSEKYVITVWLSRKSGREFFE